MYYLRTPMHSVSSVLVDHSLAVESSDPVTSMDPSSERAMQLTLSSWSPIVSSNLPDLLAVEPPAPIFLFLLLFRLNLVRHPTGPGAAEP